MENAISVQEEIRRRILKLSKFKKKIEDLKTTWENRLFLSNTRTEEENKGLALMRKIEQKVTLQHVKSIEKILNEN